MLEADDDRAGRPPAGGAERLGAPVPSPLAAGVEAEELIMHLERDQLVLETLRPVPPARLGPAARRALWALRLFSLLVALMVLYTFVERLH